MHDVRTRPRPARPVVAVRPDRGAGMTGPDQRDRLTQAALSALVVAAAIAWSWHHGALDGATFTAAAVAVLAWFALVDGAVAAAVAYAYPFVDDPDDDPAGAELAGA